MTLYVGNLNYAVTENQLAELFSNYPSFQSVKIVTDKFTGKSKGFSFVELDDSNEARNAVEELNGKELKGRTLVVNEARPKA